jgi:AraC-like DNA-binding protein
MLRKNPDETSSPAFVLFQKHQAGVVAWHQHRRAQLVYISEGVITVETESDSWVAPPQRAVWILPQTLHRVKSIKPYSICTLYVEPKLVILPNICMVVEIDSLMRELLLAAGKFGENYIEKSSESRMMNVILDRLPKKSLKALHLPEPKDLRLRKITKTLREEPSDPSSLSILAAKAGLSPRNAERLFQAEIGMTFGKWRQQLRLLIALERLGHGESVTQVALDVGYDDVSAFISMFKSVLGITPGKYFKNET